MLSYAIRILNDASTTYDDEETTTVTTKPSGTSADPSITIPTGIHCDVYGDDEPVNENTKVSEQMFTYKNYGGSAHSTCLKFTPYMVLQVKTQAWQCMEYKTRTGCGNAQK
ncbi:unnamed protein product [Rotaria sp. Silwood2]|nr:unnamed protein product [Rotaria sp. Silwood2]CAF4204131.1 unnamed protein product [Rotaria sp. Silwood2]